GRHREGQAGCGRQDRRREDEREGDRDAPLQEARHEATEGEGAEVDPVESAHREGAEGEVKKRFPGIPVAAAVTVITAAAAAPAHAAPNVDQLVVFKSGAAVQKRVAAARAKVKVGRKRCAVAGGTALATLVRA